MKKNKKLTPILTGTLLVLPSLLFLSSAQKSSAMPGGLGGVIRGAAKLLANGPKVNPTGLGNLKLNTQNIGVNSRIKVSTANASGSYSLGSVNQNQNTSGTVRPLTTTSTGQSNSTLVNSAKSLASRTTSVGNVNTGGINNGNLNLKRNNSTVSNASNVSSDSVDLSNIDPKLPIQQRLTLTLLKHGITPANPTKGGVGNTDLTRLSQSDA